MMNPLFSAAPRVRFAHRSHWRGAFLAALVFACATAFACAATATGSIVGGATVGVPVTVVITIKGAKVDKVDLPTVDGLTLNGSGENPYGGKLDFTFFLTPSHAGDYTIPAFDVKTVDGQTLHVDAIKFHAAAQ